MPCWGPKSTQNGTKNDANIVTKNQVKKSHAELCRVDAELRKKFRSQGGAYRSLRELLLPALQGTKSHTVPQVTPLRAKGTVADIYIYIYIYMLGALTVKFV